MNKVGNTEYIRSTFFKVQRQILRFCALHNTCSLQTTVSIFRALTLSYNLSVACIRITKMYWVPLVTLVHQYVEENYLGSK